MARALDRHLHAVARGRRVLAALAILTGFGCLIVLWVRSTFASTLEGMDLDTIEGLDTDIQLPEPPSGDVFTALLIALVWVAVVYFSLWRWARAAPLPALLTGVAVQGGLGLQGLSNMPQSMLVSVSSFGFVLVHGLCFRWLWKAYGSAVRIDAWQTSKDGKYVARARRHLEHLRPAMFMFATFAVAAAVLDVIWQAGAASPAWLVLYDIAVAAIAGRILWRRRATTAGWLHEFGLRGWKAAAPVVAIAVMAVIMFSFGWVFGRLGIPWDTWFDVFIENDWPAWVAVALLAVVPALIEELSFRGVIQGELENVLSANEANIIQAMMFALAHHSQMALISHFALGLVFGYLRRSTGGLYAGMIVHAVWNGWAGLAELGIVGEISW